jgi:hypothetical protein
VFQPRFAYSHVVAPLAPHGLTFCALAAAKMLLAALPALPVSRWPLQAPFSISIGSLHDAVLWWLLEHLTA